jgi:protein dithiol oxidoreductase (disulfide-forming)
MIRRNFAIALGAMPVLTRVAWAAFEPAEGRDYTRLHQPIPVAVAGKVEVIEFFGYWCPHCSAFEPKLEAWVKTLPADVNFRREPVAWQPSHVPYQRLYFALEALGLGGAIHQRVFDAVHVQHLRLDTDAGVAAFAAANGIDKGKLLDAMKGFAVDSRVRMANQLFADYHLDGVPTLTVNGRYITSPEKAGGEDRTLRVVDALIRMSRTGG